MTRSYHFYDTTAFAPSSSSILNKSGSGCSGGSGKQLNFVSEQKGYKCKYGLHAPYPSFGKISSSKVGNLQATSLLLSDAVQTTYEYVPQTFEPQVNTPALSAFLVIAVVFSLLQLRINSVRDAGVRRQEALATLRIVKAAQLDVNELSSSPSGSASASRSTKPTNEEVQMAVKAYQNALEDELNLRTIIPGVRIVAPNDPKRREEDIAAAKQFLNWDLQEELEGVSSISEEEENAILTSNVSSLSRSRSSSSSSGKLTKNDLLMQSRRRFDGKESRTNSDKEDEGELSNAAKAVLLTVALSQVLLLVVLSFDPMTANDVFTSISGPPPADVPLSSWASTTTM